MTAAAGKGAGHLRGASEQSPALAAMRAVQIIRFGGPEVLDVVDIAEPEAGLGQSSTTSRLPA